MYSIYLLFQADIILPVSACHMLVTVAKSEAILLKKNPPTPVKKIRSGVGVTTFQVHIAEFQHITEFNK